METKQKERIATKTLRAEVKADAPAAGATEGTFEARVAAFGNVDLGGDRIEPTAFDATKAAWQESGDPVPVIWSHQWDDPMAHLGSVAPGDLTVTPDGLEVRGVIDLSTPIGKQVHKLMVDRRVKEFSFAYLPTDTAPDPDNPDVRVLKGLDLIELGPTLKGMNPETELFGAKSAIARHDGPTDDGAWDGPANEARLPNSAAALSAAHAWRDPEGDPDVKGTYKFIHHLVADDGRVNAASLTASSTGIGVLNGGRGGANIPDGDRPGVFDHLAGHLRDGDREPPPLKSIEELDAEEAASGAEGTGDGSDGPGQASAHDAELKVGRVLSKANETKLREAGDLITSVLASLGDTSGDDGAPKGADRAEGQTIDSVERKLRILTLEGP